jgi:shikimate dehydrogenase
MGRRVEINTETRLCAVIGNPVKHSLSPAMHNVAFEDRGLNYVYVAFEVSDVAGCLAGMRALPGFRGMSVTIPHKIEAMRHVDVVDDLARRVGCINTVTNENGVLHGTTTDGLGTLRAFEDAGVELAGRRVLFLGTGGAVRSVAFAMAEHSRVGGITLLGRTAGNVAALAADLAEAGAPVATGGLGTDLLPALDTHDIIIQGTPMGMYPERVGESLVPADRLRTGQVVFDMVYRPLKTRLIQDAEAAGCTTILGIEMLVNQAVLQFERWTGVPAPRAAMRGALLAAMA